MRAITVIEGDDGTVTVVATGGPTYKGGVELLHKAILELVEVGKEDHAEH